MRHASISDRPFTVGVIRTYTGRYIRPLELKPSDIDYRDIAHALSNQCRFTGHTQSFYSVAQHCVLVASYLLQQTTDLELMLAGLLHDASEAYLLDLAAPIKHSPGFEGFREHEARIQTAIEQHFGLRAGILECPQIKHADEVLLRTELRDLMLKSPAPGLEVLPEGILPKEPRLAEHTFLTLCEWLICRA